MTSGSACRCCASITTEFEQPAPGSTRDSGIQGFRDSGSRWARGEHRSVDLNDWRYGATPSSVVFSPDGSRVAIAFNDGFVVIYDVALRDRTWLDASETAPSIAFTPDGQRLLVASPTYLRQTDATTGEALSLSLLPGPREVTRMTYTEDGRWLVISHPRSLTVLDARTLQVAVADLPGSGTAGRWLSTRRAGRGCWPGRTWSRRWPACPRRRRAPRRGTPGRHVRR